MAFDPDRRCKRGAIRGDLPHPYVNGPCGTFVSGKRMSTAKSPSRSFARDEETGSFRQSRSGWPVVTVTSPQNPRRSP